MEKHKPIIKRISEIFELGYVPCRGDESYFYKTKKLSKTGDLLNCFGHAVFNFTNEQLDSLNLCNSEIFELQGYTGHDLDKKDKQEIADHFCGIIKDAGLLVTACSADATMKFNQWKVALYFDKFTINNKSYIRDFHFLRQEKDGTWSGKSGYRPEVKKIDKLPQNYDYYYTLFEVYSITNPHAKEDRNK